VKTASDSTVLLLLLELTQRRRGKPPVGAAATAAVADKQMPVLNPNLLQLSLCPNEAVDGRLLKSRTVRRLRKSAIAILPVKPQAVFVSVRDCLICCVCVSWLGS